MQIALIGVKPVISNVITGTLKQIVNNELFIYTMEQAEKDWTFISNVDVIVVNLNASSIPVKSLLKTMRGITINSKIIGIHNYSNKKLIVQLMEAGLDAYIELNQVNELLSETIESLSHESVNKNSISFN